MPYVPPKSRDELLARYAVGERHFVGSELDSEPWADFSGDVLDGADFSNCWIVAFFRGASLKAAKFCQANIKTSDFTDADLTDADFRGACLEATKWSGAVLTGTKFGDVSYYGLVVSEAEFVSFITEA